MDFFMYYSVVDFRIGLARKLVTSQGKERKPCGVETIKTRRESRVSGSLRHFQFEFELPLGIFLFPVDRLTGDRLLARSSFLHNSR